MTMTKGDIIDHLESTTGGTMTIDAAIPQASWDALHDALKGMGADDTNPLSHFVGTAYVGGHALLLPMTVDGWQALAATGAMAPEGGDGWPEPRK